MPSATLLGYFQQLQKTGHIKSVTLERCETYTTLYVEAKGNPAPNEINIIKEKDLDELEVGSSFSLSS